MHTAGDADLAERIQPEATSPFFEAADVSGREREGDGSASLGQAFSPFAETEELEFAGETDALLAEALAELRDEAFHESVAFLAEETEQAVSERFSGESPFAAEQQERFADQYLSGVRFEAEQYLSNLESGLAGLDIASLDPERLNETLDQLDPQPGDLTPAGEEFIGKLIKKAKKAVSFVANKAKQLGKLAMPFLAPLLKQLRKLVRPLLKRVLSMAIGRLPAPLQPAARKLASQLGESGNEADENEMAPATEVDIATLADSFDYRLAEAVAFPQAINEMDNEAFGSGDDENVAESRDLETLAQARGTLIDRLAEGSDEAVAPAIEQFVPVVLGVLRTGIKLIGRPRVVGFLAKYLAQLVGPWVGKDLAPSLSHAIADTGLRLATLEAESDEADTGEAAPVALASVIEDTVRRLAENEEYIFENEDLTQVAVAEALGEAVATHFPQDHVREELQLAPSLGGAFVTRRPRSLRSYAKYNRTPEIEVSSRLADTLPGFGGSNLGALTRAAGGRFPLRARMHIYQMRPGSSVSSLLRHDRGFRGAGAVYPLTPTAAGSLLREPALGTAVPRRYLRTRHRVAAGQRVYILEPLGGSPGGQLPGAPRLAAGRIWIAVSPAKARITLGIYLSEAEAQQVAAALRQKRGTAALLGRLLSGLKRVARAQGEEGEEFEPPLGEEGEGFEAFAAARGLTRKLKHLLRRRVVAWALPAVATWLRDNADAFLRAADHPDPGVTLRIRLGQVPGLSALARGSSLGTLQAVGQALRGKPAVTISVSSGKGR